jgi:mannose-6-phosphate isomerase-like protein (cupin superfamily)
VSRYFGDIELLEASCNISTVQDGRGAIFSWIPDDDIKEYSLLFFQPNKVRGNHFHPEFTEYFLVVDGAVVLLTRDSKTGKDINMLAGKGVCFRTPPNVPHAVHAIVPSICVSFLTKPWDSCERPIVYEDLVPFDPDYVAYMESTKQVWNPEFNTGKIT